jgi:hypothetical protein
VQDKTHREKGGEGDIDIQKEEREKENVKISKKERNWEL